MWSGTESYVEKATFRNPQTPSASGILWVFFGAMNKGEKVFLGLVDFMKV